MFQAVGVIVVVTFALYGAWALGWLPEDWQSFLPAVSGSEAPTLAPEPAADGQEPSFTERVTGEKSPYRP